MRKPTYNYLFRDYETGEDFFIETTRLEDAIKIAKKYFEKPSYIGVATEYEAEMMGLDTY